MKKEGAVKTPHGIGRLWSVGVDMDYQHRTVPLQHLVTYHKGVAEALDDRRSKGTDLTDH